MLRNWVSTKEADQVKGQLFVMFQTSLAPVELAFLLITMQLLWNLDPSDKGNLPPPLPANYLGLTKLLSTPSALKQSYALIHEFYKSFYDAVKCSVAEDTVAAMQLLNTVIDVDDYDSVNDELWRYSMQRLEGKGHKDFDKSYN